MNALVPSQNDIASIKAICTDAIKSGLLPQTINTPEKAFIIALKGQELKLPITQAWSSINVINGKPAISSELMRALIFRDCPGAKIEILEHTNQKCKMRFIRPNQEPYESEFTIQDAQQAGLTSPTWQKYTKALLLARATSQGARAVFSDILMGCSYTPEELGAEVDDSEVITTTREVTPHVETSPCSQLAAPTPQEQTTFIQDEPMPTFDDFPNEPTEPSKNLKNKIDKAKLQALGNQKMNVGKHTGKRFVDIAEEDKEKGWGYAKWGYNAVKVASKPSPELLAFIDYAKMLGAPLGE